MLTITVRYRMNISSSFLSVKIQHDPNSLLFSYTMLIRAVKILIRPHFVEATLYLLLAHRNKVHGELLYYPRITIQITYLFCLFQVIC